MKKYTILANSFLMLLAAVPQAFSAVTVSETILLAGSGNNTMDYCESSAIVGGSSLMENQAGSLIVGPGNAMYNWFPDIGIGNVILGFDNTMEALNASAIYSACMILGSNNYVPLDDGESQIVIGHDNVTTEYSYITIGRSAKAPHEEVLLVLGNGASVSQTSNALVTENSGRTTLINKYWNPAQPKAAPSATWQNDGAEALVVDGHTRLRGKVVLEQPQGDISMGPYQ